MQRLNIPIVFLVYVVTAMCITCPIVLQLNDHVIGMANHPGLQGQIFFQKAILDNFRKGDLFSAYTDLVNYPQGQDLREKIYTFIVLYFSLPLSILFGLIPAYNITILLIFVLNGFAMYIFAKEFFISKFISFTVGLFFMFNSYILLKITQGFVQKISLFWIPLYFLFLFRFYKTRKVLYLFCGSIIFYLLAFTYAPYAYYAALSWFWFLFLAVIKKDFNLIRIFSLHIVSILPIAYIFGYTYSFSIFGSFVPTSDVSTPHLNSLRFFKFYPYQGLNLPLGISALTLLIAMFSIFDKENRRLITFLILATVFYITFSMGEFLRMDERQIFFLGHKIFLPGYFIHRFFPFGRHLIFPIRVFPFINLCISLLLGYGLGIFSKRIKHYFACMLFILFYVLENFYLFPELFPLKVNKVIIPQFYHELKNEKSAAILNLPVSSKRSIINHYGYFAVLSGKKMMNSYDDDTLSIYLPKDPDAYQIKKEFIEKLSLWDVRYIVIHNKFLGNNSDEIFWLKNFCEKIIYPEDDLEVYKIPRFDEIGKEKGTIYIPENFPTIQKGIEAAKDGNILFILPGIYKENINFKGKAITIKSINGPELTTIDGDNKGSVITFNSGEDNRSILEGFTIRNGTGMVLSSDNYEKSLKSNGGGIICIRSSLKIINNIVEKNNAENGGGICCLDGSSPLIKTNIVRNNKAVKGGGIRCSMNSSPIIEDNKILYNKATRLGGGIYWRVGSYPIIRDDIIVYNSADERGGGLFGSSYVEDKVVQADVIINNCIIRNNVSPIGSSMALGGSPSKVKISCSNIEGGQNGIFDPEATLLYLNNNIDSKETEFVLR